MTNGSLPLTYTVSLSASSLGFGTEVIDEISQPDAVTITNSGTGMVNIDSIVASANFAETNTCGMTLGPRASCTINVTFNPSATGMLTGNLSITDNASGSPQQVSLNGTGASSGGGRCATAGEQCPPDARCCTGLMCVATGDRSTCE